MPLMESRGVPGCPSPPAAREDQADRTYSAPALPIPLYCRAAPLVLELAPRGRGCLRRQWCLRTPATGSRAFFSLLSPELARQASAGKAAHVEAVFHSTAGPPFCSGFG